jgi:tetratricopeptide (TPR) repeat protein
MMRPFVSLILTVIAVTVFLYIVIYLFLAQGFISSPTPSSSLSRPDAPAAVETIRDETVSLNNEALRLARDGRLEEAVARLEDAIRTSPQDPAIRYNLAMTKGELGWRHLDGGRLHDALKLFEEALAIAEPAPEERPKETALLFLGLGTVYYRLGDGPRAIDALQSAIGRDPSLTSAYKLLAELHHQRDETDLAIGYYEKAVEQDPEDRYLQAGLSKARREGSAASLAEGNRHFTVRFEDHGDRTLAIRVVDLLEEAYQEIGRRFEYYPSDPITVTLYPEERFRNVTLSPAWTQGIFDGKIRLPLQGAEDQPEVLRRVIHHEYTHALIHARAGPRVPTWINEGLALHSEPRSDDAYWSRTLTAHLQSGRPLLPLTALHGSLLALPKEEAALAYAEGFSAVRLLMQRHGLPRIVDLLEALSQGNGFEAAFERQLGQSYADFEREWLDTLHPSEG